MKPKIGPLWVCGLCGVSDVKANLRLNCICLRKPIQVIPDQIMNIIFIAVEVKLVKYWKTIVFNLNSSL